MLTQQMGMHAAYKCLWEKALSHIHSLTHIHAHSHTEGCLSISMHKEVVKYQLFLCAPCVRGSVTALIVQCSEGWGCDMNECLLRVMSNGKIKEWGLVNKRSVSLVCRSDNTENCCQICSASARLCLDHHSDIPR